MRRVADSEDDQSDQEMIEDDSEQQEDYSHSDVDDSDGGKIKGTQRSWDEDCYICSDGGDVMVCEG